MHGGETEAPYVIAADNAFLLMENLMNSYHFTGLSKEPRVSNYHLSRGRRIVEIFHCRTWNISKSL